MYSSCKGNIGSSRGKKERALLVASVIPGHRTYPPVLLVALDKRILFVFGP